MKIINIIGPILLLTLFMSCSDNEKSFDYPAQSPVSEVAYAPMTAVVSDGGVTNKMASLSVAEPDSRIQVTGHLSIEVPKISTAMLEVENLLNTYGAQITNSNSSESYQPYSNITIIIVNTSFYDLISKIKTTVASKVTHENMYSTDVTEEYLDTEARLNVMQSTENRFVELLSETKNVEETIQVEKELMRIRGDIDSFQSRLNYLDKTTDNSILHLNLTEETSLVGENWSVSDSFSDSIKSLVSFSKTLADIFVTILIFSPVVIAGIGIFFGLYKLLKKIRAH